MKFSKLALTEHSDRWVQEKKIDRLWRIPKTERNALPQKERFHEPFKNLCFQVVSCPNPDSCTYTSRQAQLQKLQTAVRVTYQQLQRQQAGDSPATTQSSHHHRSTLAYHTQTPAHTHTPNSYSTVDLNTPTAAISRPLMARLEWLAHTARGLLGSAAAVSSPTTPPLPPPPVSPRSEDVTLIALFITAIGLKLDTYAAVQCSPGYTGQLCGSCADGYGTQGVSFFYPRDLVSQTRQDVSCEGDR